MSYSLMPALWWHGLTVGGKGPTTLSSHRETSPRTSQKRKYGQAGKVKKAENTSRHRRQACPRTFLSQSTSTMHRGPGGASWADASDPGEGGCGNPRWPM